jgi:hypothetical protein
VRVGDVVVFLVHGASHPIRQRTNVCCEVARYARPTKSSLMRRSSVSSSTE